MFKRVFVLFVKLNRAGQSCQFSLQCFYFKLKSDWTTVQVRPVGWGGGGSVGLDEPPPPPTEAIEFHLAWLKQGSKVCKDNKPYAAICFKWDLNFRVSGGFAPWPPTWTPLAAPRPSAFGSSTSLKKTPPLSDQPTGLQVQSSQSHSMDALNITENINNIENKQRQTQKQKQKQYITYRKDKDKNTDPKTIRLSLPQNDKIIFYLQQSVVSETCFCF